jgi:hypothetical protein
MRSAEQQRIMSAFLLPMHGGQTPKYMEGRRLYIERHAIWTRPLYGRKASDTKRNTLSYKWAWWERGRGDEPSRIVCTLAGRWSQARDMAVLLRMADTPIVISRERKELRPLHATPIPFDAMDHIAVVPGEPWSLEVREHADDYINP